MTAADRLSRIRPKIERAKQHIGDLERAILDYRSTDPYRLRVEEDFKAREKVYLVHERSPIPEQLALIAGDAVHNLRSALDHLAWQLVEAGPGSPSKGTSFPIRDTAPKKEADFRAKIKGMKPGAESLIESLQPYKGGNGDLWTLHRLDIIDKHQLLLVAACAVGEVSSPPIDTQGDLSQVNFQLKIRTPFGKQPDGTFPIMKDGTEFARSTGSTNVPENNDLDLSFEIAFAEPQIVQGKPVLPFVHQLAQLVDGIVRQFVPFL
jgi:hypothetical protein